MTIDRVCNNILILIDLFWSTTYFHHMKYMGFAEQWILEKQNFEYAMQIYI